MKKLLMLAIAASFVGTAHGFVIGLQLGDVAFGIGGSKSGGPVIGVGKAPDNGRNFSAVIVPGDCCCNKKCTKESASCCKNKQQNNN